MADLDLFVRRFSRVAADRLASRLIDSRRG